MPDLGWDEIKERVIARFRGRDFTYQDVLAAGIAIPPSGMAKLRIDGVIAVFDRRNPRRRCAAGNNGCTIWRVKVR